MAKCLPKNKKINSKQQTNQCFFYYYFAFEELPFLRLWGLVRAGGALALLYDRVTLPWLACVFFSLTHSLTHSFLQGIRI